MTTEMTPVRTAVIMARGLGTRMRKQSEAVLNEGQETMAARGMKGMIDVGRPFLDHVITAAADAGITDVCLIIGPEHDEIRSYYTNIAKERVRISFAVQAEPRGTGDAVAAAEASVGTEPFCVLNSDNYYPAGALALLQSVPGCGLVGFEPESLAKGNIPAERIKGFALLETTDDGLLRSIVEKPDQETIDRLGAAALVSMNCYRFTPAIFDYLRELTPSPRGEYELTDAVRAAVDAGEPFYVVPSSEAVLDLSTRQDVSGVEAALRGRPVSL